jgi:hypothetical protein
VTRAEGGRVQAYFWANPWIFVLYGFCLALPLIVWVVRAYVGTVSPIVPVAYAILAVLGLAWITVASALRVADGGLLVPNPIWTFGNLWHAPRFVAWSQMTGVRITRTGVLVELAMGSDLLLEGYHRAHLEAAIKSELERRRSASSHQTTAAA